MPEQQRETKNTRATTFHETYANNCNLRVSNWDVFFEFGKLAKITDQELEVISEVGIYVSPQQAKALSKALAEQLAQYEKSFGEIVIQPK